MRAPTAVQQRVGGQVEVHVQPGQVGDGEQRQLRVWQPLPARRQLLACAGGWRHVAECGHASAVIRRQTQGCKGALQARPRHRGPSLGLNPREGRPQGLPATCWKAARCCTGGPGCAAACASPATSWRCSSAPMPPPGGAAAPGPAPPMPPPLPAPPLMPPLLLGPASSRAMRAAWVRRSSTSRSAPTTNRVPPIHLRVGWVRVGWVGGEMQMRQAGRVRSSGTRAACGHRARLGRRLARLPRTTCPRPGPQKQRTAAPLCQCPGCRSGHS